MADKGVRIRGVGANLSQDELVRGLVACVDQLSRIRATVNAVLADPNSMWGEEQIAHEVLRILDEATRDDR